MRGEQAALLRLGGCGFRREAQARVFGEQFAERRPALFVERLEGVEINRDDGGIVLFQKRVDGSDERVLGRCGREFFDGAVFVVGDAEAVEEIAEQFGVRADQPDLQQMRGDAFVHFAPEGVLHPRVPLAARLALDEDGPQFPLLGEGVDGRFVERLLSLVDIAEKLLGDGGREGGENFVGLRHKSGALRVGAAKGDASPLAVVAWRAVGSGRRCGMSAAPSLIKSLTLDEVSERLGALGQPAYRTKQVMQWIYGKRVKSFVEMSDLPAALRQQLAAEFAFAGLEPIRTLGSRDTTLKYLFKLDDGALIEAVLIPASPALYGEASDRRTLCVSTQVGCAYGCKFCASGLDGWSRNLQAGEIVDQVLRVEELSAEKINNIVFMGMGEPLANFANLMKAVTIINAPWGVGLGARHITISTSGLAPQIKQLADQPLQVRLAISLHGATDEVREQIMPVNRKYPLATLLEACAYYTQRKKQWLTFEYILIEGVNDRPEDAAALVRVARKVKAKVNCIPYNKVEGLEWKRPSEARQDAFMAVLEAARIPATIRREKGHDIAAACGQLRRQTLPDAEKIALQTAAPRDN